jgi:hypothetical protein
MRTAFQVTAEHISRLKDVQLTTLLRRLLHLEAERYGLPTSGVSVPLNITVSDGGEDGRIQWSAGLKHTNWIPRRLTLFQIKATSLSPEQCANELCDKQGKLKPSVSAFLKGKGAYVFVCGHDYNKKAIDARVKRADQCVRRKIKNLAKNRMIDFYDANRMADWTNEYFAAAIYVLEACGQALILGLQT